MYAVITGDIINSRKVDNPAQWLDPLKELFSEWGTTPQTWEIFRGDSFQVEIAKVEEVLRAAFRIKAVIKSIGTKSAKRSSPLDVRIAIGIGEKTYLGDRISESSGSAFIHSGEKFETLKKEKLTMAISSGNDDFDKEMNLFLKMAMIQMDNWSISSGELANEVLKNPGKTQSEIGANLGIEQNSVSGRYKRANIDEILELEALFKEKLSVIK